MKLTHHFCIYCNTRIAVAEMSRHLQFECPVINTKREGRQP